MSDTVNSIVSIGSYLPRRRLLKSAIFEFNRWFAPGLERMSLGSKTIANWDEDSVTMATEAARACLDGVGELEIGTLALCSTSLPFAHRLNAGIVKEALNLSDSVRTYDATGNFRVGLSTLAEMLSGQGTKLCLASNMHAAQPGSEVEMTHCDAAAAILVGHGSGIAKFLGSHSMTQDFVDQFRSSERKFDYHWESRWIREVGYKGLFVDAIKQGLKEVNLQADEVDHAIISAPSAALRRSVAGVVGLSKDSVFDSLLNDIGFAGVADPILCLSETLKIARPGQKILVAGFGQGAEVVFFEVSKDAGIHRRHLLHRASSLPPRIDTNYGRYLFHRGLLDLEKGMRSELDDKQPGPTLWRNRRSVLGLVGSRNQRTGEILFPKMNLSLEGAAQSDGDLEDYYLSNRTARVVSVTADRVSYSPDPPLIHGVVAFEGGGRMTVEFADVEAGEIAVSDPVKMVFRIKSFDSTRGFVKYYWKATAQA